MHVRCLHKKKEFPKMEGTEKEVEEGGERTRREGKVEGFPGGGGNRGKGYRLERVGAKGKGRERERKRGRHTESERR